MARAFRRAGRGKKERYVARLDALERSVVVGLLRNALELIDPPPPAPRQDSGEDPFDAIVAGLESLDSGPVPQSARSYGDLDPALQRLFPAGNRTDDRAAAEFRRLTEPGLRRRKAETIERAISALSGNHENLALTRPEAVALLVALTDVRLVLGERLGLRHDDDVERLEAATATLPDEHPAVQALAVYDFLTWLQETLAHSLLPGAGGPAEVH